MATYGQYIEGLLKTASTKNRNYQKQKLSKTETIKNMFESESIETNSDNFKNKLKNK